MIAVPVPVAEVEDVLRRTHVEREAKIRETNRTGTVDPARRGCHLRVASLEEALRTARAGTEAYRQALRGKG